MKRDGKPAKQGSPRSAYAAGLDLLARRDHSARELDTKLVARGHDRRAVGDAIDALKSRKYQSDERFAEALARSRAAQGYGPRRIGAELKSHGVAPASIRGALAAVEGDWDALAMRQLRRRFGGVPPADAAERARRAQFLLRRGFDPATVRRVTRADVGDPDDGFD